MFDELFYRRHAIHILAIALFSLPITGLGAIRAVSQNANDVRDWLPRDYPETKEYAWFQKYFGSEEFVAISWEGCTLNDPRLDRAAASLKHLPAPSDSGGRYLLKRVITGKEILEELMTALNLSRSRAESRLAGTLIHPDTHQTCLLLTLTEHAKGDLHQTLPLIRQNAADATGLELFEVKMAGPPVVNAAIDETSGRSLLQLVGLAGAIGLVIAWWCFRSLKITIFIFVIGLYTAVASLSVVGLSGVPMNAILMTMAPLVYVASMSGGIHLSNYYLDAVQEAGEEGASGRAVAHAWVPLSLATGTTAVGLLSLGYSELLPIQQFGLFSAIGVVIGFLLLIFVLPSILEIWPPRRRLQVGGEHHETGEAPLSAAWRRFGETVVGNHALFTLAGLAALVFCACGLLRGRTSLDIMRFFPEDSEVIETYRWYETELGGLVPMEVVICLDKKKLALNSEYPKLDLLDRMELVDRVEHSILELDGVVATSALTFAPPLPSSPLRRAVFSETLERRVERYSDLGYVKNSETEQLWRISLRVKSMTRLDYGVFVEQLKSKVSPELAEVEGSRAVYTGMVPIVWKARRSLLDGLIYGFGTDLLLIVISVIILMRHWSPGLTLLLTSIFPTLTVFGAMGWLGIVVDIGSVMTPSVALGVTVDDVVHFLLWFRRVIQRGLNRPQAVMLAYEGCARAMYQSWGVLGLGLSVFALSAFTPTMRFGALMVTLLTAGLIGNLCFLPALLAGPIGAIISRPVLRKAAQEKAALGEMVVLSQSDLEASPNEQTRRASEGTASMPSDQGQMPND